MQRIVIGRDARFLLYRMTETAMATRAGSASLQSSIHKLTLSGVKPLNVRRTTRDYEYHAFKKSAGPCPPSSSDWSD